MAQAQAFEVSAHPRAHFAAAEERFRTAPADVGTVHLVVARPAAFERQIVQQAVLDTELGLVGDDWLPRATGRGTADGRHFAAQLTIMSHAMAELLADDEWGRAQAGDQLHVDLDLSTANLPAGTRLAVGDDGAVVEVTEKPHNGCGKYRVRYGADALAFVNSALGKELRLRGLNARVIHSGTVRPGDSIRVLR